MARSPRRNHLPESKDSGTQGRANHQRIGSALCCSTQSNDVMEDSATTDYQLSC